VRSQSRTWDDAVPEADNSKERAEKIDKILTAEHQQLMTLFSGMAWPLQ
jgi:hypothetical protein